MLPLAPRGDESWIEVAGERVLAPERRGVEPLPVQRSVPVAL